MIRIAQIARLEDLARSLSLDMLGNLHARRWRMSSVTGSARR
jgi:hypothetical protein